CRTCPGAYTGSGKGAKCAGCAGLAPGRREGRTVGRTDSRMVEARCPMAKTRREQLEEMLADDPSDPFLHYGLAMEHVSAGDAGPAVRRFGELFRVAPTYVPAYQQAGQALARLGRLEEAGDVLRQGIAVARQQNDAHALGEMQGLLDSLS